MTLQDAAFRTADASDFRTARGFERPVCPSCGDRALAPEASEFMADGRIRHHWICESCGTPFRTAVTLGRQQAA